MRQWDGRSDLRHVFYVSAVSIAEQQPKLRAASASVCLSVSIFSVLNTAVFELDSALRRAASSSQVHLPPGTPCAVRVVDVLNHPRTLLSFPSLRAPCQHHQPLSSERKLATGLGLTAIQAFTLRLP